MSREILPTQRCFWQAKMLAGSLAYRCLWMVVILLNEGDSPMSSDVIRAALAEIASDNDVVGCFESCSR